MKIENADSAVATVTGLQVGTYGFSLTVADDRLLQNSDTVTVIVREGECVHASIYTSFCKRLTVTQCFRKHVSGDLLKHAGRDL